MNLIELIWTYIGVVLLVLIILYGIFASAGYI